MRRFICFSLIITILLSFSACCAQEQQSYVVATTLPVYEFATHICNNTEIEVEQLVTENISCLHDYSLQSRQVRMLESAEIVIISGAGLEDSFTKLFEDKTLLDASRNIPLICSTHDIHEDTRHHSYDPHIWLKVENAVIMAQNIYSGLTKAYPKYENTFKINLSSLITKLNEVQSYGNAQLSSLSCRKLITFHEGFSYFADGLSLEILHSIEEESGSEASAKELKEIINIIKRNSLPAIFTEKNGSASAADIICSESGVKRYCLDMAISGESYFTAMYHNIDTIKEALE